MWRRQWSWWVRTWMLNRALSLEEMAQLVRQTLDNIQEAYERRAPSETWEQFRTWAEGYAVSHLNVDPELLLPPNENDPQGVGVVPEPGEQTEGDLVQPALRKRLRK